MKFRNTVVDLVNQLDDLLRRGENTVRSPSNVDGRPGARVLVRHDVETRRRAALNFIYGLAGAPYHNADLLDGDPERELEAGDGHLCGGRAQRCGARAAVLVLPRRRRSAQLRSGVS